MALHVQKRREGYKHCIALIEHQLVQPLFVSFLISLIQAIDERGEYGRPDVSSMHRKSAKKTGADVEESHVLMGVDPVRCLH